MRFRDYIVNTAIKRNYKSILKSNFDNLTVDNIYVTLADKFGYKINNVEKSKMPPCDNKVWEKILHRTTYDKNNDPKRFFEYDSVRKKSFYFSESGMLYTGICGVTFLQVSPITEPELYKEHEEFLNYVKTYYKTAKPNDKQYVMLGYNDKHRYYICSDKNFYYTLSDKSSYQRCSEKMNDYCYSLMTNLEK